MLSVRHMNSTRTVDFLLFVRSVDLQPELTPELPDSKCGCGLMHDDLFSF